MKAQKKCAEDIEAAANAEGEVLPLLGGKAGGKATNLGCATADDGGIASLSKHFGHKLLIMLFASQHLMKGFSASFTGPSQQFLYAAYKVPGPQMQIFGGVTQLPWAMKPIIGLVSDLFPVMGFHKMPYIVFATCLGIMACATVGLVPQEHLSVTRMVCCFFLMSLMFSTADLLTEAKYAEKMRSKPEHGPALMSYVWGGLTIGGLAATAFVGPVLSHWSCKVPFVLALLPLSFILIPLSGNYLEERVQRHEEVVVARKNMMKQHEACALCLLMFVGTIILTFLGIFYESAGVNAAASLAIALVMLVSFSVVLRPVIAKVNAFSLIQTSLGFSIGGASFYFYTDSAEAYPEGPHFSKEFFTSVLGVFGAICSLIGIWSYQKYAANWTYRRLLISTNLVLSALSLCDVVFFTRLNVRLGIPDHIFVLGSGAFAGVIGQWMWMPGVVIMSQLCPEGMEATMYALLAGCHNLGNTIASNCGALVLEWLGCQPEGNPNESAQFQKLWLASLLSTVLPLLTVLLVPWMIPDAKQTDKLLPEGDRDAMKGSLLRRWRGRDDD